MELIEGVKVKNLRVNSDERGWLMEILRVDDDIFKKFGQAYLTTAYCGVVKAWHYHKVQTDNFVCIKGMMKVVLYDNRKDSPTYKKINEFFIGEKNYMLISIPPFVYHGFKAIGDETAFILNIPTETYNYCKPDEYKLSPDTEEINYNWILDPTRKNG